jgi:hypothetical protein
MQATEACGDCVVTYIHGREPGDAVVIDVEEERVIRRFTHVGLLPGLRHRRAL